MEHHHLEEDKAERFVADWFQEHFDHFGAGYETGPWSRVLTCTCSPDANHTISIANRAYENYEGAYLARKVGSKKKVVLY